MKILLMHQTVTRFDAIGNDIEMMYRLLNEKNTCFVYAQNRMNDLVRYAEKEEALSVLKDPENLAVYHHSVFWEEGEQLISKAKCKIVFRYHNVTPSAFFAPYNDFSESQCRLGREQTVRLSDNYKKAIWLCDSSYNAEDLPAVDPKRIAVCPPFNKVETWAGKKPDDGVMRELLYGGKLNLLFVGRIAPNKGHLFLLEALRCYCENFSPDIILRIVGKADENLRGYNDRISECIGRYGLANQVQIVGEINDGTLMAYYLASDLYVCASEHEGFCVPLIEAQYFELPLIALALTAVPFTAGKEQVLLNRDPKKFAAAIRVVSRHAEYRDFLRKKGLENYRERYALPVIGREFKAFMERMGAAV